MLPNHRGWNSELIRRFCPTEVVRQIEMTEDYHAAATSKQKMGKTREDEQRWNPPPSGFMKINFDATFENSNAFLGVVLRNSNGSIIKAWTGYSNAPSPYVAEAEASLQTLRMADEMQISNLILEGDALNVIRSIKGDNTCIEWQGKQSIISCRKLLSDHCFWAMYHVYRERNWAAHNLAKWAKDHNKLGYFHPVLLPPSVFCDRGGTWFGDCTLSVNLDCLNEDG